ncbi:dienelactone hydrolase family protein [Saccharopolyspora rhizosphaerae]|uniref:Dienelactone hydrolase family protein n=1 Tax=Saccharopolyspora rhizosphaerae TaxID=2492662 RepID=A0A3R8QXD6_9PSEU|nr:dienelactone hydrolase family protein [Saccharopolyspora rhizosphaerae]
MARVVLFHSVLGLRAVELNAAERLRRAGHEVVVPDLFGGGTASTLEGGFRLLEQVGWAVVVERARRALAGVPGEAVLAGMSMGTGVVSALLPERPATGGVLFLHAAADLPEPVRSGLRVQLHAADPDEFAPAERVAALREVVRRSGLELEVFRYPGVGHFYTDPELPDHDVAAAELTWRRVLDFLEQDAGRARSKAGCEER